MIWLILAFVAFAAFTDLRSRQIPNSVSAAICVCGVVATAFGLTAITWGSPRQRNGAGIGSDGSPLCRRRFWRRGF